MRTDDFEDSDRPTDAALFIHFAHIILLLGDLTEHYCRGTLSDRKRVEIEDSLHQWLNDIPASLRLYDATTRRLNDYNLKSRQLHVPFFVVLVILYRPNRTSNLPPSPVSLLAASFVSGIFEEYLTWEDMAHLPAPSIFYLLVAALLQLSSHRFHLLAEQKQQQQTKEEIEIITLSLNALKKRFPTALGAERVVNQIMRHATAPDTHGPACSKLLSLTPDQKDYFSPFGPELCRKWYLVFNGSAEADQCTAAAATDHLCQLPAVDNNNYHPAETVLHVPALPGASAGHQAAHSVNNLMPATTGFGGGDDLGLFADQASLDTVGRWWWADWMPEVESDVLY